MLSPAHTETLDIIRFLHLEIYSSVAHQIPAVTQFVNVLEAGDIVEVLETVEL